MRLLDLLKRTQEERRLSAAEEYRAVLERADAPRQGDAERLEELLPLVGRIDEVADDADSLARIRELRTRTAGLAEAEQAVGDAQAHLAEVLATVEAETARLRRLQKEAEEAVGAAFSRVQAIKHAVKELREEEAGWEAWMSGRDIEDVRGERTLRERWESNQADGNGVRPRDKFATFGEFAGHMRGVRAVHGPQSRFGTRAATRPTAQGSAQ